MKKISLLMLALIICIFAGAQGGIGLKSLPIDPDVRYGKLENGLTYYIRHNKYPEKRADFYLAQKVGSMQEEDSQAGLAHFLEHMAFNGTKHFPGRKTMLNYLESIGAQFGSNVNAYTGFDETVYTLSNIPITRQGIIDSTLLVLHDWSGYISLEDEEIDKERPIIKEEWRTRSGAQFRIWNKQLPILFKDSKYADRMPIGKMEVVENFKYQELKDYYHKWYRPDLQAVIVVGDFDADKMEAQVKELFSKIPMPENAAKRIYHTVPDTEAPIVSVVSDKEETKSLITYYIKHDVMPEELQQTEEGYAARVAISLGAMMLGDRLSEISKTAESPFIASHVADGDFFVSKTKDAWTSIVISKEGREKEALASLVREVERVKRFGFTDVELDRAKANLIAVFDQAYNNRDKEQNGKYVQEYVESFTDGTPIPGIAYEYEMVKRILPQLSSNIINGEVLKLLTDENNIITITGPEKEGLVLPAEAEVLSTMKVVYEEDIEPYIEEIISEPLLAEIPTPGKIIKEEKDSTFSDMTIWTLSNGIKVNLLPTKYKDDEILMSAISHGGYSLAEESEIYEASLADNIPYIGGVGNFSTTQLNKVLAGKNISISPAVGQAAHGFSGYSSKADIESFMQLLYLYFTAPRKDEEMFANVQTMLHSQIKNAEADPGYALNRYTTFARYGYNPRYIPMTVEDVKTLNYDAIIDFYKQLVANGGAYTFTFVGSVDKDVLKPLVETYLGSLPTGDKGISAKKENIAEIRSGKSKTTFEQAMVEPKATFYCLYKAKMDYNQKNRLVLDMLSQVLDIVYTRTIREAEGGTYGVGQSTRMNRVPEGESTLTISFDTDTEKIAKLVPIVYEELEKLATDGVQADDFNKVREYTLKAIAENQMENSYWRLIAENKSFYNEDSATNAIKIASAITSEDIKQAANEFLKQGNLIEVIMEPREN